MGREVCERPDTQACVCVCVHLELEIVLHVLELLHEVIPEEQKGLHGGVTVVALATTLHEGHLECVQCVV
jgi:hypothetical protein